MRRRQFITLLGGAAATWPLPLRAQQPAQIPRIGIIDDSPMWNVFRQGLRDLGYLEGQTIAFDSRYADGVHARLAEAAAELVRRPVDVITTYGTPPTRAAQQATTTIPIVMIGIGDPVGAGLVASLARPGGNITGNTILGPDVAGKRLQLLKEVIPSVARAAFLWNPDNASHPAQLKELQAAAPLLGMQLLPVAVRSADELDSAFAAMMRERADAFLMTADPLHQRSIRRIIDFLTQNRLPGMFLTREIVVAAASCPTARACPSCFGTAPSRAQDFAGHEARDLPERPRIRALSTARQRRRLVSRSPRRSSSR